MSENTSGIPKMISGFGTDVKLFAACADADKNGHSLELGINQGKVTTIGGLPVAGVGGGNMTVLPGMTSTWWDIARAQVEGKTVYLKFGIPGFFSTLVGPIRNSLGTLEDGNKIQAVKRAWYASQYFTELKKINLAYRKPAEPQRSGDESEEEEPVEYQDGFVPFTYDEALEMTQGTLPLERFDLYMYGRGCGDYSGYRDYYSPAVSSSYDDTYEPLDFSEYVPNLDDPAEASAAQSDYDRWKTRAGHIVKDYTTTDEYIRSLVGYYLDEIPTETLDKYTKRLEQINMAFRTPAGEIVPLDIEPAYQSGYTPFEEGDAVKLISGQLPLDRFAVYCYAEDVVSEDYEPSAEPTVTYDFDSWINENPVDESDYDNWTIETYESIVATIQGELLSTILGVLYDTLMPYEVDIDVTLGGVLRMGIGIAYKRSMPFITPRYVAVGLPNTYAIDLKSFRDAGADLSSLESLLGTLGILTGGQSAAIIDKIKESTAADVIGGGGLGNLIGGGNDDAKSSGGQERSVSLAKGGTALRSEITRNGEGDGEEYPEDNGDDGDDSGDSSDSNVNKLIELIESLFGIEVDDPESVALGVASGLADATLGRNDDIFYLFCMAMDINRRASAIPGLSDLIDPEGNIELDPHKGFIVEVNGWNIFAPITGDANKGLDLTKIIDELDDIIPVIEQLGDRIPGLEDVQALLDTISELLGIGTSLDRIVEILQQVNNMTLSFSTLLNQRAMYKLVEKEWPVSLLRFDKDTMRLYSTQCLAKVAGAAPASTVISTSNFAGLIGTAMAELLLRAIGNYNFEFIVELLLSSQTQTGIDDAIRNAFSAFTPLYGLEWHGVTEIPIALGVIDGLPHDLANVHIKAGITFRTDDDDDGGNTGTGVIGVLSKSKLSVESMESDFIRNYAKLTDATPFKTVHNTALLGKGIIYNMSTQSSDDDGEKSADSGENSVGHSWEMHGEVNPAVYRGKDAVQLRIEGGDGSTMDLVGTENLENIPEYIGISGEEYDDRLIGIGNAPNSVSYHLYNKEDITGEGDITSLKFKCGPGQSARRLIYVFLKEYSAGSNFNDFDASNPVYPSLTVQDLVYLGEVEFNSNGFIKIPICSINTSTGKLSPSSFPYSHDDNLLVVVMDASDTPVYDENDDPESTAPLNVYFSDEGNYSGYNTICRSSDEQIIPIDGAPAPSSETAEALHGVSNITFGFSEPYVVPDYSYDVDAGTRAASDTDDRLVAVDGRAYSISCHIISSDDIVCHGEISSLTFYRNTHGVECERDVDVYISKIPADFFPDVLTKEQYRAQFLVEVMVPANLAYSGTVSSLPSGQITIPVENYEYDGSQNLLVIIDDHTGESVDTVDAPHTFYTPYVEPDEPSSSELNEEYRSICFFSDNAIDLNDGTSFDNVNMEMRNGMLSMSLNFSDGEYVVNDSGTAKAGSESLGHFGPIPVNTFNARSSECHMIYPAGAIRRGGKITGMRLYYSPYWECEMTRTLKICLRHTRYSGFTSKTDVVDAPVKDPQFEGEVHFVSTLPTGGEPAQHWVTIEFDDEFIYDGYHNLLMSVYDITGNGEGVTGSFSMSPDTKQMLTIGSKTKMVDYQETTVPFGYNSVAVCEFVFDYNDDYPTPMGDMDCITPDWEANRVVGSEPVDWKIVATETRGVRVKTLKAAMDAFEWFGPQGVDVCLDYNPEQYVIKAVVEDPERPYDFNTEFDFMPPWYAGGNLRFRVFEMDEDGLYAIAEADQMPGYYSDSGGPKSQSSSIPLPPMPVKVTYILAASEEYGVYVFAYQPKLTLDIDDPYAWNEFDDSLDKSGDAPNDVYGPYYLDPDYLHENNVWCYATVPDPRVLGGAATADVSAYYVFMAVNSGLVTLEMTERGGTIIPMTASNTSYDPYLVFAKIGTDEYTEAYLYGTVDDGQALLCMEYARGDLVDGKMLGIDESYSLAFDENADDYLLDYTLELSVDQGTYNYIALDDENITGTVEIVEQTAGGDVRHQFADTDNPIPTNISVMHLDFERYHPSARIVLMNNTTVHFADNNGQLEIASGGTTVSLFVGDYGNPKNIEPGKTYVLEILEGICDFREVEPIIQIQS